MARPSKYCICFPSLVSSPFMFQEFVRFELLLAKGIIGQRAPCLKISCTQINLRESATTAASAISISKSKDTRFIIICIDPQITKPATSQPILIIHQSYIRPYLQQKRITINNNPNPMRIFISLIDESGTKRTTRITVPSCATTNNLIKQICREIKTNKANVIIKMKYEPHNLRLVDNWPLEHYPIKNGSMFLVDFVRIGRKESFQMADSLEKIEEEVYDEVEEETSELSFLTNTEDNKYSAYFQDCLNRMLDAVRMQNLQEISRVLNDLPDCKDEDDIDGMMKKKLKYLLNEAGDCGRNALHWAIHLNNPDIVSFLIIKGANPTILTIDGYTPLQLAVQHHSPEIMKLLIDQKKIDVNQATKRGTALHLAVMNEDRRCVEILLQNDADIETLNPEGQTALEICKNKDIKLLLQKRSEIKRLPTPNITKGRIFKITSMTYRAKQKVMLLNPFKNQFTIYNQDQKAELTQAVTSISAVEAVEDKSWLMSSKMEYFRILLDGNKDQKEIMFGVKNAKIYKKWLKSLELAIKYNRYIVFIKATPANEQVIEMLDDQKNEITLYKRKVDSTNTSKKNISIMNLKLQEQAESQLSPKKSSGLKKTQEGSASNASENEQLRESQIILGSVLQPKNPLSLTAPARSYTEQSYSPEGEKQLSEEVDMSKYRFRKNSEQKYEVVTEFKTEEKVKISYDDFVIQRQLGSGAFGQVYLASFKRNQKLYALKVLNKKKLISKKHLKYAVGEANILKKMDSPFIVKLYYAFQTPMNLYMVLDNCSNGDLSELIMQREKLSENTARFVIAQLVLAVQYLHKHKILYRDLKPQNILIASDGYIRLTDFGLSRENSFSMSFCGSPAYLSPQMLEKKGVGFSSDIYGIGCVLYEMLIGEPPFFDENLETLLENIKAGKLRYASYLSVQSKSLISKLLQRDLNKRLGVKDIGQIKKHDFFKKMDWALLQAKKIKPPREMLERDYEAGNFFEAPNLQSRDQIKLVDSDYNETTSMLNRIKNFTFVREDQLNNRMLKSSI